MIALTQDERRRYTRQIMMPEIGEAGQVKLKAARVVIAGLGGLGSVSGYYLAAAGVGHLTIVDGDRVDMGNLNRQVLYDTGDIGRPKTEPALKRLAALNPACRLRAVQQVIDAGNVMAVVGDAHIILDATDNVGTRKILNRASVALKIPFVYGGVNRFNGMVSTFIPGSTPCFECLFPMPSATEGPPPGIIGPTTGLVGAIQSLEALKLILGVKGLLTNQLLSVCGMDMTLRKIRVRKNPACRICGPNRRSPKRG